MSFYGIPMIQHVYERVAMAIQKSWIYIASPDDEIINYMNSIGAKTIKTHINHVNGTSRVIEATKSLNFDKVIIVQADEILLDPKDIKILMSSIRKDSKSKFWNLVTKLDSNIEINDKNIVKCTISKNKVTSLFRELPLNYENTICIFKIKGIMAFNCQYLNLLETLPDTPLQNLLSIEQLKILENGFSLTPILSEKSYPSINSEDDIEKVFQYISVNPNQQSILKKYAKL